MKTLMASFLLLPLMAAPLMAESGGQSLFRPTLEPVAEAGAAVRRAEPQGGQFGQLQLSPARVKDVDTNGDKRISFAELIAHDVAPDF